MSIARAQTNIVIGNWCFCKTDGYLEAKNRQELYAASKQLCVLRPSISDLKDAKAEAKEAAKETMQRQE